MKNPARLIALVFGALALGGLAQAADSSPAFAPSANLPPPSSMDNPAPALDKSPPPAADASPSAEVKPVPDEQSPIPVSSLPGKTADSPKVAPPASNKDLREEYEDYQAREKEKQKSEHDLNQRNLFPHEDGAWQLGFEYTRNAFTNYNFAAGTAYQATYADNSGPTAMLTYFPLRSLSFGRLGVGVAGGYYWSTFNLNDVQGNAILQDKRAGAVYTYGLQAVYEFDYLVGQILVPFAFVGQDQVVVKSYNGLVRGVTVLPISGYREVATSYGGGVNFNLNRVEPVTASRALVNTGVRKYYITYRATDRLGKFSGLTHSLGLRFEF